MGPRRASLPCTRRGSACRMLRTSTSLSTRSSRTASQSESAPDGRIEVYNHTGTVNVDVDVDGYYSGAGGAGSAFVPITPVRLTDTRVPSNGTPIAANTSEQFNLSVMSSGIPTSADAVATNMTVVPSDATGYLTVYPTSDTTVPVASDLNWTANEFGGSELHRRRHGGYWQRERLQQPRRDDQPPDRRIRVLRATTPHHNHRFRVTDQRHLRPRIGVSLLRCRHHPLWRGGAQRRDRHSAGRFCLLQSRAERRQGDLCCRQHGAQRGLLCGVGQLRR